MGKQERIEVRHARLDGIEQVIKGDGETEYLVHTSGDPDVSEIIVQAIAGPEAEIRLVDEGQLRGSTSFGFSGRWNAPWNPEGPKKNWRTPPADPSLN